jgi:tetratricopeptide (TPR) repeat protein
LATLERTIGNDEIAAEHFEFLERMVAEQAKAETISNLLLRHPEFIYTVQYNQAVCLAKEKNPERRKRALAILDELIASTTESTSPGATAPQSSHANPPTGRPRHVPGSQPRLKIEMLARSARAAALLEQLERGDPNQKGALFQQIKYEKNWFEALRLDHKNLDWQTYALGYAVALNAFGQACCRLGYFDVAVGAFREAMVVAPDFVDAYNNLAAVYLNERQSQDPEWAHKLEDLLQQALQIQGSSQKAHLLLGRYYSLPGIARFEEARKHLEKATLLSWSHYYLAEILIHQDRNREEALKILRRSIFMDKWPDRRYVTFIESALDVSQRRGGDRVLLKEALQLAEKYLENGQNEKQREKSFRQELLGKVNAALDAALGGPGGKKGKPDPLGGETGDPSSGENTPSAPQT